MAISSAIISVIGTGVGLSEKRKARQKQSQAEKLNQRQNEIENQRRIRQQVAQARVQQAQVQASAIANGTGDSSGLAGGLGSAQTQLGANVGFANQQAGVNATSNALIGSANRNLNRASTISAISNLPSQFGFSPKNAPKQIKDARAAGKNPFGFGVFK